MFNGPLDIFDQIKLAVFKSLCAFNLHNFLEKTIKPLARLCMIAHRVLMAMLMRIKIKLKGFLANLVACLLVMSLSCGENWKPLNNI